MDDNTKLRQLETKYRLRVRTGCETCRVRKVKCDETKPACLRCTKTGRECKGYDRLDKPKKGKYAAAASFRNADFLVVPQRNQHHSVPTSLIPCLSKDPLENRSFQYFQTHTLPSWTEFFDSELWSRKVLQLSHLEPAIKHGLLALSVMHERFQDGSPVFTRNHDDFAFVQYAQAVKHSNRLLLTHSGQVEDLEPVLIACIIFICYENLAGNFRTANMHLKNGMRLLRQHEQAASLRSQHSVQSIANVLTRFDLQAMTFSDNASMYEYNIEDAPICPEIPDLFENNDVARDTLAGIMRCMMWVSGVADKDPRSQLDPLWLKTCAKIVNAFKIWEIRFAAYQDGVPLEERRNPKRYAGDTILKMGAVIMRIFEGASVGIFTEMAWDAFMEDFKTIVDLAETLTALNPGLAPPFSRGTTRSSSPTTQGSTAKSDSTTRDRRIAPNPAVPAPPPATGPSNSVFAHDPGSSLRSASTPSPPSTPSSKDDELYSRTVYFSPSFELSPLVPLFVVSARCRDPILRRRAISLLLSSRRREGCWDSFGAGMCALQAMKHEEDIPAGMGMEADGDGAGIWVMNPDIHSAEDIPEERRVRNIFVSVKVSEGVIETGYELTTGQVFSETVVFERKMVRSAQMVKDKRRGPGPLYPEFWSKSRP